MTTNPFVRSFRFSAVAGICPKRYEAQKYPVLYVVMQTRPARGAGTSAERFQ